MQGFVNYTYMARKTGNFGLTNYFENPVRQQQYLLTTTDHYQSKPIPEPFVRFNVDILTPSDFGPNYSGFRPLATWRLSILGEWRAGQVLTWTGNSLLEAGSPVRGVEHNVRWKDYYNVDLRLSKTIPHRLGEVQFFMDVTNVFNIRHLNRWSGFVNTTDLLDYLQSLHLPEKTFEGLEGGAPYPMIPGNDRPGDYRKPGVEFVPIIVCQNACTPAASNPSRPLYYKDGKYFQYRGNQFVDADPKFVDRVLKNKAYIDMPNADFFTFFNPRRVFFGIRVSF